MRFLLVICFFFTISLNYSIAQLENSYIDITSGCFYNEADQSTSIRVFKPTNTKYLKIIQEIILYQGIKKEIQIYEANIDNALATIIDGKMIIVYDTVFLNMAEKLSNFKGGATLILAHEIGHLLNIHSLSPSESSSWWDELDADYFVGSIVLNKKILIDAVYAVYDMFPTMSTSKSHPEWQARIKTTINGYCNAVLSNVLNTSVTISDPNARIKKLQTELALLLNESLINTSYDQTINYTVSNLKIIRSYKNDDGESLKEELLITDISSIELRPHDVGEVSFIQYSGDSYWWSLGGKHNKEIIETYNSKGYFIIDDETSTKEDLQLLKNLCLIIGEIKLLSK
jgi:hypothetical protein